MVILTMVLVLIGMVGMASARLVTTTITARIGHIPGNQLPTDLFPDDIVTFSYLYDNESTIAHIYDFTGVIVGTSFISDYPFMNPFLSDAKVTYSDNLLESFAEYSVHTGYNMVYDWVYARDSGTTLFFQSLLPHVSIWQGTDNYGGPISDNDGGHIISWTGTSPVTTAYLYWISVSTVETPRPEPIYLDIKPGSSPNSLNPQSKGKIPVAILSTQEFFSSRYGQKGLPDLRGPIGDEESLAFCSEPEDINGDGLKDLVCHFYTQEAGFQCGDAEGILKGETKDGTPIEGKESVRIVSCT